MFGIDTTLYTSTIHPIALAPVNIFATREDVVPCNDRSAIYQISPPRYQRPSHRLVIWTGGDAADRSAETIGQQQQRAE
jgi:hypothetical protein